MMMKSKKVSTLSLQEKGKASDVFNIAIFGIGAMGCLFGSHLDTIAKRFNQNHSLDKQISVHLVGTWPEQIQAIQQNGLVFTHNDGTQSHHDLRITDHLDDLPPIDLIFILVKSFQTTKVAKQIQQILHPETLVITLQNGLGNKEMLAQVIDDKQIRIGITEQGATLVEPGLVRHGGNGTTYLASHQPIPEKLDQAAFLLNQSGLEAKIVENADSLIWSKLLANAAVNPLSALFEVVNGKLLDTHEIREVMFKAAEEVYQLTKLQNIKLSIQDAKAHVEKICLATYHNHSSMLQDIMRGAPTEIEAISGAIVKIGEQLNHPIPVNAFLLQRIKAKEKGQTTDLAQLSLIL